MPDILSRLARQVLVVDGAMGTMLQRAGVPAEQCPEQLNVTAPEIVEEIHRNYVLAGAHCATTNTFGASRPKLAKWGLADEVREFNRAAVRLARHAGAQHVLADVGPTGLTMAPVGDATFDEVFEAFAEQVAALVEESPDAIFIETMSDIAEARCAVLAARSVTSLPVFATVTFGTSGRMDISGTPPEEAAVILEAAGASAVGANCGLGPEQLLPLVSRMGGVTSLPLVAQPNAGLPRVEDGRTVFTGTPDEMGVAANGFAEAGAVLVGSCCGSTPSFTGAIADVIGDREPVRREAPSGVRLAGPRGSLRLGSGLPLAVIGERINPTGKRGLADSLREGSMSVVREFAVAQQHQGAHALDVNVGGAGIDTRLVLPQAVTALVSLSDLPLVLDDTDPAALEAALKAYPGRALVNSVNGGRSSLTEVLPVAARYGAAVVVLALDDDGIPETVEGRLDVVQRVREAAHGHGMTDADLVVDCLTLTAATDPRAALTTVECVRRVTGLGLATVLGVSNVSHGLPGRPALNAAFLSMAAGAGLSAAIVNPGDADVARAVAACDALRGSDVQAAAWIARVRAEELAAPEPAPSGAAPSGAAPRAGGTPPEGDADRGPAERAARAVETGDPEAAAEATEALLAAGRDPQSVISGVLTPAIQRVGEAYGRGESFLPQLMASADAMKAAVAVARRALKATGVEAAAGRVVFGTVKGDIHSIGKDICVSLLESHGFVVSDLGVDVPAERFAEAAREADAVCISALMTTTLRNMEAAVRAVLDAGAPALVGGAVVTSEWAASVGAGYADDAPGCVAAVRSAVEG